MANGHPSFGGSNEVPLLDVGQQGGVLEGAGTVRSTIQVLDNPATVATATHHLAQQNVNVRDVLGFTGERVRWELTLRARTFADYNAIRGDLNKFKTGAGRTVGVLDAFDPALLRETRLTDFDGAVIATRVVLSDWRTLTRRRKSFEWDVIVRMQIDFEVIG